MTDRVDVVVMGGGMAGISAAAEIAAGATVRVIEAEAQPGYHATGRSAAVLAPSYGPAPIRALTRLSAPFFAAPPEGFADGPVAAARPHLFVARGDQVEALDALVGAVGPSMERLDAPGARAVCPLLREGYAAAGGLDRDGRDLDVAARMGVICAREVIGHVGPRPAEDVSALFRAEGLI